MRVVAIVQARMSSSRLPKKVMKTVVGKTVIQLLLERLSLSKRLDEIVVATSTESSDDALVEHLKKISVKYFRGSEADVLSRFMGAAETYSADVIVRITGDCPLVDSNLVDFCIDKFCASSCDYLSNIDPPSFPDGLDVEVFSISALRSAFAEATTIFDREHVTPYLRTNARYSRERVLSEVDYSLSRWTLDEQTDFEVIENVFKHFSPRIDFNWLEVRDLQKSNPKIFSANSELKRDGGASMGSGQKLWRRAKQVIPGGNMLLSKRSEMFLPDQWPAYFSKVKGCRVWDLDGNEFIDMSIMGIGTNILGYGDEEVDNAVRSVVDNGNMSTLNCPEEVFLAERLIELHPWADMVRFARSGGEANSIAIRIARAAVGKSKVAICGYHGWHDWYLSANLGDEKNLAGHLLPGLEPNGVPEELRGTVLPFVYNDFDGLEALIQKNDIGVIKMEVSRNFGPENGFLERVRELATKKGIVLIFDECTSGFRQSFGGIHKIYGVEPDMAMFGKAMGNGYAITAVIGRREIMQSAQTSFISSTFWTERIGPVAGLKTLEVMERTKSWELISEIGVNVAHRWRDLAQKNGVSISISGIKALPMFSFDSTKALEFKTYLTQEMLARGFLATTSLYASVAHTPELIERYFDNLGSVFETISKCEEGLDISTLLNGPVAHSGFKRLN
jgi:glutamate-1-semialdehyde 2,1-aminomutase